MTCTNTILQAIGVHRNVWEKEHRSRVSDQIIEEMAELMVALSHKARGRGGVDVMEEIADVEICLWILKDAYGVKFNPQEENDRELEGYYRSLLSKKALRLIDRLNKMKSDGYPLRAEP